MSTLIVLVPLIYQSILETSRCFSRPGSEAPAPCWGSYPCPDVINAPEFHFWGQEISHKGHRSPDLLKLVQAADSEPSAAQPDPQMAPSGLDPGLEGT